MIRIHTGVLPTEQLDDGSLVVGDPAHYPIARRRIYEALIQKEDLEVFVVTSVCDRWFWDLFDYQDSVVHIDDAPTERLKRKLSISTLPIDMMTEPNLIIELGLLDLSNPTETVIDVWKWVVQSKLGAVWVVERPSKGHFSQLVNWYIDNTPPPTLQPRVMRIFQIWIEAASGRLRSAYARFFEDPRKTAFSLIAWKALSLYGREVREQWLISEGLFSPSIDDLANFVEVPARLPDTIRRKLYTRLLTHWNTRLKERFND